MYETRIVKVAKDYFVEYRWKYKSISSILKGIIGLEPFYWVRYMAAVPSIKSARKLRKEALESYELNYSWNTKVVK